MNFIDALERADSPARLAVIFNALAQRSEEEQQFVANQIINNMMPDIELTFAIAQMNEMATLVDGFEQGTLDLDDQESVVAALITAPKMAEVLFAGIEKIKKDETPSLVTAFLKEAAKLTPSEKMQPRAWLNAIRKLDI